MRVRACEQVRAAACEAFSADPGAEQAERWTNLIEQAVRAGVRADGGVYTGAVDSIGPSTLVPRSYDVEAVRASLDSAGAAEEVRQFLFGCVVAALDATDIFGSELVSTIIVGFVLHATVARRDQADAHTTLGRLAGQRAVLDTPVLIRLLGPRSLAESTEQVLRAAVAAGMEVVVADHTLEELIASVEHARATSLPEDRQNMSLPEVAAFGRLVDNHVVALAAEAVVEGRYRNWEEFERAASGMRTRLRDLDIACRPHGNYDADTVGKCRRALANQLALRGRHRPEANLDRDAHTMAMLWRARRRSATSRWPGGWVVSSDQSLTPAMAEIEENEPWPFALTLPQLAAILTRCGDVPSLADLTRATATLLTQDAAESLACRYPAVVASELARSLAARGGGTPTDIRIAQGGLNELLSGADIVDPGVVTSMVMNARQRRLNLALGSQTAIMKAKTIAAEDQVRAREAEILAERAKVDQVRADLFSERAELDRVQRELADQKAETARQAVARSRQRIVDAILVAHLFVFSLLLFWGHIAVAALVATSGLLFWGRLRTWAKEGPLNLLQAILAGIPDLVSVGIWMWTFVGK
jgi:hypothetical protein